VTLTIEAGVMVLFTQPDADVIISGTLYANGTQAAPIHFQPLSATKPGNWGHIAFMAGSSGALDHAILENGGSGSGMVYIASDAVRVENSIVQYSANTGIYIHASSPLISGTQILTNTAGAGGGGIYNDTGNPIIQSSIIRNNSTSGYSDVGGGGIYNGCGNPIIQNNRFIGNIAEFGSRGGGLYSGCGKPLIQNNIIAGNVAKSNDAQQYSQGNFGGGIYSSGDPIILNNVFTGNNAEPGIMGGMGGGLFIDADNAIIRNNIIINNHAYIPGSGIYNAKGVSPDYNDIWNNDTGGTPPGTHNLSADPLLVDPANGDFHLEPGSPCIDAGDPDHHPETDFEGDLRPMGAAPDIGVDEYRTMMVAKVGIPEETSPGGAITYTVKLTNLDKVIMTNVLLTDTLPAETAFIGYQAEGLTCAHDGSASGGLLNCTLDSASLAPGESRAVTLTIKVTDTLPGHIYVNNDVEVTARSGEKIFLASDRARTWVSDCTVRLNDMPMGRDLQAAIDASTHTIDIVKVYGYCRIHDLRLDRTLILGGGWSADFSQWNPMIYTTTLDGQGQGPVIKVEGNVNPTVEGFIITGGYGMSGGGVSISTGNPVIQNNIFYGNSATYGGGLFNASYADSSPIIQYNTFYSNTAGIGGGLEIWAGNPVIQNNIFSGNSADNGGGVAIYNDPPANENSTPVLQNNIFSGNSADNSAGGIYIIFGNPIIQNNTFTGNLTRFGGGILIWLYGNPTIRDNIIVNNAASITAGGILNESNVESLLVDYNDVWNNNGGDYYGINPGVHDIHADPLLVDPINGDFHLAPGSPCIDAGDPNHFPPTDFEGDPRPMGLAPDIGSDEFKSQTPFLRFVYLSMITK
jgi:uncharacterized repeat protein (TIGR01451 family)